MRTGLQLIKIIFVSIILVCCNQTNESAKYYDDGTLFAKYETNGDKKNGKYFQYHKNGMLAIECVFKNDSLDGILKEYDEQGVLLKNQVFNEGLLKKSIYYHENGIEKISSEMNGKLKDGGYFQMNDNGDTIYLATFRSDTLYYEKAFNSEGKVIKAFFHTDIKRKDLDGDSISIITEIDVPLDDLNFGFYVGSFGEDFIEKDKSDLIDTLAVGFGNGRIELTIHKNMLQKNYLCGHFVEFFDSEQTKPLLTISYYQPIDLIPQIK